MVDSDEFNLEFDDLLDKAKQSFKVIFENIAGSDDLVDPKEYGFETEDEMLLKNWDLLDPEDQEHLRKIGLNPEKSSDDMINHAS